MEINKLNFKAKNQASSLAIHQPFASKYLNQNIEQNIQKERNDRILELFAALPLDEDEQDFINDNMKSVRHVAQLY